MINIIHYGAVGDGKTDNTCAIQQALDDAAKEKGTVYVPCGHFMTGPLTMHPFTGLSGEPVWGFRGMGGSILQLNDPKAGCLIDVSHTMGVTVDGLCLNGQTLGDTIHGIMLDQIDYGNGGEETTMTVSRCRITGFSGHGVYLNRVWCFRIRHNMIAGNGGDGVRLRGWDGFILDNFLTANEGAGFAAHEENASVTFTANRVEWNYGPGMVICGGSHYNITGNYFDRSGGPGIALRGRDGVPSSQITVTGNVLYRNGKPERDHPMPHGSSHIDCQEARAVLISGNVCEVAADDPNSDHADKPSPDYGMILGRLNNCIVKDNIFDNGYLKEIMVNLDGHNEDTIIRDNIGSPFDKSVRPDMANAVDVEATEYA